MAINPEIKIFANLERAEGPPQEILTPAERQVMQTIVREMKEARPRISEFSYSPLEKAKDQAALRAKIEEEERSSGKKLSDRSQRGILAEALVYHCVEMHNWFGENCATVATSEYDDHLNGADLVLEFDVEGKVVRLAVDVTLQDNTTEKENEVLLGVEDGELTKLKYFASEIEGKRGKFSKIPRIILKMDVPTVQELSRLIVDKKKEQLAKHKVQADFLAEAKRQLKDQIKHAEDYYLEVGKDSTSVIRHLQEVLDVLESISTNKKEAK